MTLRSTPDQLVAVATRLFAARGFYGVSIAAVAEELSITKQALLHHFGNKERLYAAVLADLADRIDAALSDPKDIGTALERFWDHAQAESDDMALIARELLDNEARADTAQHWFLRPMLQQLVALARAARPELDAAEAAAEIYVFIGAVNYHAISGPTLRHIFGKQGSNRMNRAMPRVLRQMIRARFLSKKPTQKV